VSEPAHKQQMTSDEFIAWATEQPETVTVAPERSAHARTTTHTLTDCFPPGAA
jgi:hypothetical protein